MRSTVDIHDSIDRIIRSSAKKLGISYKEALNRALASGLHVLEEEQPRTTYRIQAKACGFRSGVDVGHLNRVADELDDEERLG